MFISLQFRINWHFQCTAGNDSECLAGDLQRVCPKIDLLSILSCGAAIDRALENVYLFTQCQLTPSLVVITATRFIKGRIDPRINCTALHKSASKSRNSLALAARSADRSRRSAAYTVATRSTPRYAIGLRRV